MDYRDERDALRGRVENLEQELGEAKRELHAQRGDDRASRVAQLEKQLANAQGLLDEVRHELSDVKGTRQAPQPRDEPQPDRGAAQPELGVTPKSWWAAILFGLAAIVVAITVWVRHSAPAPYSPVPAAATIPPLVATARTVEPPTGPFTVGPRFPMFARDGAGATVDPLVWGWSGPQGCLARFDARTGASAWINCAYAYNAAQLNRSAVIGDHVLVEFERDFDGLDVKTGAKLWTTRLDQRIWDLCLGPDGTVRVVIEGGDTFVLAPETGKLTPSKRTYDCQVIWGGDPRWGHHEPIAPGQHFADRGGSLHAVDGMVPRRLVAHGDRTIVLGYEKPGPHVPMAAAVDKKGKLLWKRELPPADQGIVDTDAPSHATLDDRRLCATYSVKQGVRVGCWDPTTGAALWDSPIGFVKDARELGELVLTARDLILLHDAHNEHHSANALGVFDLATGGWRYDIQ